MHHSEMHLIVLYKYSMWESYGSNKGITIFARTWKVHLFQAHILNFTKCIHLKPHTYNSMCNVHHTWHWFFSLFILHYWFHRYFILIFSLGHWYIWQMPQQHPFSFVNLYLMSNSTHVEYDSFVQLTWFAAVVVSWVEMLREVLIVDWKKETNIRWL